jgi:hypothetical protein
MQFPRSLIIFLATLIFCFIIVDGTKGTKAQKRPPFRNAGISGSIPSPKREKPALSHHGKDGAKFHCEDSSSDDGRDSRSGGVGNPFSTCESHSDEPRFSLWPKRHEFDIVTQYNEHEPDSIQGIWLATMGLGAMVYMMWYALHNSISCCFGSREVMTLFYSFLGLAIAFACNLLFRIHVTLHYSQYEHRFAGHCRAHVISFIGSLVMTFSLYTPAIWYLLAAYPTIRLLTLMISFALLVNGIVLSLFIIPDKFRVPYIRRAIFFYTASVFMILHLFAALNRGLALFQEDLPNYLLGTFCFLVAHQLLFFGLPKVLIFDRYQDFAFSRYSVSIHYTCLALAAVYFFYRHQISIMTAVVSKGY